MVIDYIVIGAGISGINTAKKIQQLGLGSLLILEKSRGIGGRMATRRTLNTKFDHGAQFYKLRADVSGLHSIWMEKELTHQWFTSNSGDHWCSNLGMTSLAKSMAENIPIALEKQISSIRYEDGLWKLISHSNEEWICKNLIISSPLPQTIKLLEEVDKKTFIIKDILSEISKISYTKALIGLITLEEDLDFSSSGYQEFISGDIFSISDQRIKGTSEIPALTITMSAEFSEIEFENSDEAVIMKMHETIKSILPKIKIQEFELKKWRYCKANSCYKDYYLEIAPKLFLIGDAFGGASLSGALRSSNALCDFLIEENFGNEV